MKRVLAIFGAGLLIIIAIVVRHAIDDNGGGGGGASSPSVVRVTCVKELEVICDDIESQGYKTTVADASDTVTALGTGKGDLDVWVTFEPWATIAGLKNPGTAVASTTVGIVVWKDRAQGLKELPECATGVDWKCLGAVGGQPWPAGSAFAGNINVGLPPRMSALGLLVFGNAVAGFEGNTTFGTNDLDNDDAFAPWLAHISSGATLDDPLTSMLTIGVAQFTAVGTTEADFNTKVGAHKDQVSFVTPSPVGTVRVVLAGRDGLSSKVISKLAKLPEFVNAITDAGYDRPFSPPSGLPDPDVLAALRSK